jgi:hypothetical protein
MLLTKTDENVCTLNGMWEPVDPSRQGEEINDTCQQLGRGFGLVQNTAVKRNLEA